MRWPLVVALCVGSALSHLVPAPCAAVPSVTLWVVQPPGEVVAFDLANFARVGGVRIPQPAFEDPAKLSINGKGQILVTLDADHIWLWDGDSARTLPSSPRSLPKICAPNDSSLAQWLLGDDGKSLFVLMGTTRQVPAPDSLPTRLVAYETDLHQRQRATVFDRVNKPCLWSEWLSGMTDVCPDPEIWAPGGVVRGYFVLTHWEQRPPRSASEELPKSDVLTTLYRQRPTGWRASDLQNFSIAPLLDAGGDGSTWVQRIPDYGCCGWNNGSNDQLLLTAPDTNIVLFDERSRFHNPDYDVSYFAANAGIAPDGERAAYTLRATAHSAAGIRASAEGHADTLELAAIRDSLAQLPLVLVHDLRPTPTLRLELPHAVLIGWLSKSELLVVQDDRLVAVDVLTRRRRFPDVSIRSPQDAIVVWR